MNRYKTFWLRVFAILIDGFILGIASKILNLVPTFDLDSIYYPISLIDTNMPFIYAIYMVAQRGQTYGKQIVGIKILDFQTESPVSFNQSLKREIVPLIIVNISLISGWVLFYGVDIQNYEFTTLGKIIVFLPGFIYGIWSLLEIVTMLFDDKKRALHDYIAGTVCVNISYHVKHPLSNN